MAVDVWKDPVTDTFFYITDSGLRAPVDGHRFFHAQTRRIMHYIGCKIFEALNEQTLEPVGLKIRQESLIPPWFVKKDETRWAKAPPENPCQEPLQPIAINQEPPKKQKLDFSHPIVVGEVIDETDPYQLTGVIPESGWDPETGESGFGF